MQIENRFIGQISSCHRFWKHLSNGKYGFQCPYCRWGRKPSDRTAYLMPRRRSPSSKAVEWWFRCNHCNHSTTFEKFLEAHHPLEHSAYLLERYQQGTTGKGTNCPNPDFKELLEQASLRNRQGSPATSPVPQAPKPAGDIQRLPRSSKDDQAWWGGYFHRNYGTPTDSQRDWQRPGPDQTR